MFPKIRLRRNRKTFWLRDMVNESFLTVNDLVLPIFVVEGENIKEEISTMPGVYRLSMDNVLKEAKLAKDLGIRAISIFPVISPDLKTEFADEAYNLENLVSRTIRYIKNSNIDIGIICDVALDPYTNHGHDGILDDDEVVDNDETLEALKNQSLTLVKAGADILAPSDMMDGRVLAIREHLDEYGYYNIPILSYAAKYASSFYSPFRNALGSDSVLKGNKSTYQMDIRNLKEALREVEQDISEGADMVMIKPGIACLDVIYAVNETYNIPIFAYQVSGEYSMLKFAALNGAIDYDKALIESLTCLKRAGARAIFTYGAIDAAKILRNAN